jgi:hypothetical protein
MFKEALAWDVLVEEPGRLSKGPEGKLVSARWRNAEFYFRHLAFGTWGKTQAEMSSKLSDMWHWSLGEEFRLSRTLFC